MLAVSGNLNPTMFGPSVYPFIPREALEGHSDPDKVWKPFDERAASRRTIYAFVKRSLVVPMLEVLDFCDTTRSTPPAERHERRPAGPDAAQRRLRQPTGATLRRPARRRRPATTRSKQIERAFRLAFCRPPTPGELAATTRFLEREARDLVADSAGSSEPIDPERPGAWRSSSSAA